MPRSWHSVHALTGCDSIEATYGLARQQQSPWFEKATVDKFGQLTTYIVNVTKPATAFMATCLHISSHRSLRRPGRAIYLISAVCNYQGSLFNRCKLCNNGDYFTSVCERCSFQGPV